MNLLFGILSVVLLIAIVFVLLGWLAMRKDARDLLTAMADAGGYDVRAPATFKIKVIERLLAHKQQERQRQQLLKKVADTQEIIVGLAHLLHDRMLDMKAYPGVNYPKMLVIHTIDDIIETLQTLTNERQG